jgi:hypothetical protein
MSTAPAAAATIKAPTILDPVERRTIETTRRDPAIRN